MPSAPISVASWKSRERAEVEGRWGAMYQTPAQTPKSRGDIGGGDGAQEDAMFRAQTRASVSPFCGRSC